MGMLSGQNDATTVSQYINQLISSVDALSRTTIYNGKQIINGAYAYNATATGANAGNISDIRVTSANVPAGAAQNVSFKVDAVAEEAGIQMESTDDMAVGANTKRDIVITDANGKSVTVTFENTAAKTYTAAEVYTAVNLALGNNPDVALEATSTGSDFQLTSTEKGTNVSFSIRATDTDTTSGVTTAADIENVFSAYGGTIDDADADNGLLSATGTDWKISGLSGTVVTNDDRIDVYSNGVSFSASLSDAVLDDDILSFAVTGGTSYQLGKDVTSAGRYNIGISTINSNSLKSADGKTTLADLGSLDYNQDANVALAREVITDIVNQIASERGRLGTIQKNVLGANQTNLEDQLAVVTETEATISNTDIALESSRLARQELIAQSAMSAIQYARSFSQFAVSSLFQ
jgi:flagellin-like hook-associated protein FlgL